MANPIPQNRPQQQAPKDVAMILQESSAQIARALPKHMTADRMLRIFLTEVRKNPKLGLCDPYSFMGAVIQCAQLGLEPGSGLGHAYLVPYGKEVTLIPGYKGLVDLARRSGQIKAVHAYLVHKGDFFEEGVKDGIPYINWKEGDGEQSDETITHAFAVCVFKDGGSQWATLRKSNVDKIRDGLRYKSDVWRDHYGEMAKKSAVRRLAKLMPQSPELVAVQEFDDMANDGQAQGNHRLLTASGLIGNDYDVTPGVDADKIGQEQAAAAQPHDLAHEKRLKDDVEKAAKATALLEFQEGCKEIREIYKGDPEKILGRKVNDVAMASSQQILAAVDSLSAWAKKEQGK